MPWHHIDVLINSRWGVYIPQQFARKYEDSDALIAPVTTLQRLRALAEMEPEHPDYWDCWEDILDNVTLRNGAGTEHYLDHSDALFAVSRKSSAVENGFYNVWLD